ncbi:hypothetical protein [Streptomyces sp. NBC_00005]|uniref:hypothetical protein n=1 Tax=Streptomyces sp. NBC_00005 TaxID=2903609 RepID=UPI00324A4264
MSADREASHDMTDRDIALLLADAADGVEIGIAPTQAVIRGGRRRRARRWALATAAAVAIVGTTGTVALAGLQGGGDGHRGASVATRPPATAAERHVYDPQVTTVAQGTYKGKEWQVTVEVWGAPRNQAEAERQSAAFAGRDRDPVVDKPAELVGKTSFFAVRTYGDEKSQPVMFNTVKRIERLKGTDMENIATRFSPTTGLGHLVIGEVAKTAKELTCHWKDGTSTVVRLVPANSTVDRTDVIRPVAGFAGGNWFVCVAPSGTSYLSAEVTG